MRAHADELAADLVISADGAMWRPTEPSLSIASKGLVALDVVVTGADADLHSGRYGGTVANPVHALAEILAGLHDRGRRGSRSPASTTAWPTLSAERPRGDRAR